MLTTISIMSRLHKNPFAAYAMLSLLLLMVKEVQPIAISTDVSVDAIAPGCVTLDGGSTSCHVGVNPVPSDPALAGETAALAGGDLSLTTLTLSQSGSIATLASATWTASETDYLGISTISSTVPGGSTVVTTSTQYISFITAMPTDNSAAGVAVIGGLIIAPALIPPLQDIAKNAARKSTSDIVSDINSAFARLKKPLLTAGDVELLADFLKTAAIGASVGAAVELAPFMNGLDVSITVTSTTTEDPIITAIVDPPYDNYEELQKLVTTPSGPTPTEDDFEPTPSCTGSNTGTDPGFANQLAAVFCDPSKTDFKKDAAKELSGADLDPKQTAYPGISILFNYKHDTGSCSFDCVDNYKKMISTCKSIDICW